MTISSHHGYLFLESIKNSMFFCFAMEETGGVENLKRPMVRVLSTGPQDRCWQGVARSVQRRRMHRRRVLGQMSRKESGLAGEGERVAPGGNPGPLDTDADQLGRFLGHLWAISGRSVCQEGGSGVLEAISNSEGGARGTDGAMEHASTRALAPAARVMEVWVVSEFNVSVPSFDRVPTFPKPFFDEVIFSPDIGRKPGPGQHY